METIHPYAGRRYVFDQILNIGTHLNVLRMPQPNIEVVDISHGDVLLAIFGDDEDFILLPQGG